MSVAEMTCSGTTVLGNAEFLSQFEKRAGQLRTPLFGSLELTSRCNLRCVQCYLGCHSEAERGGGDEMSTPEILSALDQITRAGCFHLLLTGGEPFLRADFPEIYLHAKRNGLLVTVFSNGTLVTDEIAALLAEYPPCAVEVSLYGATEETTARITGAAGAYRRCLEGIRKLLDAGVAVKLKTLLMTMNKHEFPLIERHARDLGIEFRFDAALFPRLNGDRSPVGLRVSAQESVDAEFSDPVRKEQWQGFFGRMQGGPSPDRLYFCGAGRTSFHIDASGALKPCLMMHSPSYDLRTGDFEKGWRDVIPSIHEKRPSEGYPCRTCERSSLCGYCPAFFALETGSEQVCSRYLCETGEERFNRLAGR